MCVGIFYGTVGYKTTVLKFRFPENNVRDHAIGVKCAPWVSTKPRTFSSPRNLVSIFHHRCFVHLPLYCHAMLYRPITTHHNSSSALPVQTHLCYLASSGKNMYASFYSLRHQPISQHTRRATTRARDHRRGSLGRTTEDRAHHKIASRDAVVHGEARRLANRVRVRGHLRAPQLRCSSDVC